MLFSGHFQGKITVKMVTRNMVKIFDSEVQVTTFLLGQPSAQARRSTPAHSTRLGARCRDVTE